jgi:hypothetical protein
MALAAWGCNKSEQPSDGNIADASGDQTQIAADATAGKPSGKLDGPKQTTYDFLEACRTGNDDKANSLLSAIARQKMAEMDFRLKPPASDTAKFTIDNVKYLDQEAAQVAMTWTDFDMQGRSVSNKAVWVLRKDAEGWRIVGTAAIFFPGEDPVVLNFEDPADVKKKFAEASEKTERMDQLQDAGNSDIRQAEQSDNPDNPARR